MKATNIQQEIKDKAKGIVFALENRIYALDDNDGLYLICEREHDWVTDLAARGDELFDAGGSFAGGMEVYETLSDKLITKREGSCIAARLAVVGEQLYDYNSKYLGNYSGGAYIHETFTNQLVAWRSTSRSYASLASHYWHIRDLAVIGDQLYDASEHERQTLCNHHTSYIYQTFKDKIIVEKEGKIGNLAVMGDKLFYSFRHDFGGDNEICSAFDNRLITKRKDDVHTLVSDGEQLYDGGKYKGIYRTFDDKRVGKKKRKDWVMYLAVAGDELYYATNYGMYKVSLSNGKRKKLFRSSDGVLINALLSVDYKIIERSLRKAKKKVA